MTNANPSTDLSTATAKVRKFPCEACGADVRWEPGVAALRCPYCGKVTQLAVPAGGVAEKPVEAALRQPRDLGWGAERKVISCQRCGAHTTLEPHAAAGRCPFCGTSAVVEAPANENVVRPEGLLPFHITREQAVQQFGQWLDGLWLRPSDLKSRSRMTALQGIYLPFWTFDAATYSEWTADAGYYYYVDVQVQEDGKTVTRQERRVRWEPADGTLEKFFDDVPVPASRGIEPLLARAIEPYPTADLVPYEPGYLAGFLAEENAVDLADALTSAKQRMQSEIDAACGKRVPGDTYRNLQVASTYSALAYKNCLLPIWIAAYDYNSKPYRYIVNGVTGKASGKAPWSVVKIILLILAIMVIALVVGAISDRQKRQYRGELERPTSAVVTAAAKRPRNVAGGASASARPPYLASCEGVPRAASRPTQPPYKYVSNPTPRSVRISSAARMPWKKASSKRAMPLRSAWAKWMRR
jgi:predicted RNA-binding Zn-ribbon protein involved in translation (DUF1610 family)